MASVLTRALPFALLACAWACSTAATSGDHGSPEDDIPPFVVRDGGATLDASPSDGALSETSTGMDVAIIPKNNGFPAKWIDGTACSTDPDLQAWEFTPDTFILRQSLCTTFEGPFMYLFVGAAKALLIDTGTGGIDLRGKVMSLLAGKNVDLVVAHSHSHGDHVQGDPAFKNQAKTTVVGTTIAAVRAFFGITADAASSYDLGGRIIDVLPIPGHQAAHLAYYDHETKVLLTGDTLYPGRLYIDDWDAYRTSVPRLVAFVDAGRPLSFVLGGHIELRKTGPDFPFGTTLHPSEHALQLGDAQLRELAAAVKAMGATPSHEVHTDFIIDP